MKQLKRRSAKSQQDVESFEAALMSASSDPEEFAKALLSLAESEFGVKSIVSAKELARPKSSRLVLSFAAQLFNANAGLDEFDILESDSVDATPAAPGLPPVAACSYDADGVASPGRQLTQGTATGDGNTALVSSFPESAQTPVKGSGTDATAGASEGGWSSKTPAARSVVDASGNLPSPSPVLTETYQEQEDLERMSLQGELMLEDLRFNKEKRPPSLEGKLPGNDKSNARSSKPLMTSSSGTTAFGSSNSNNRNSTSSSAVMTENARPDDCRSGSGSGGAMYSSGSFVETEVEFEPGEDTRPEEDEAGTLIVENEGNEVIPTFIQKSCPPILLLQHRPAWELHVLLRLYALPYVCRNIDNPVSGGTHLPCLHVGDQVVSQRDAARYLASRFGNNGDATNNNNNVAQQEGALLCSFIETEIATPICIYQQLFAAVTSSSSLANSEQRAKEQGQGRSGRGRFNLANHVAAWCRFTSLEAYFLHRYASQHQFGSKSDALAAVDRALAMMADRLTATQGHLCTKQELIRGGGMGRGPADAALFGQLHEALLFGGELAALVNKYAPLTEYLKQLRREVFTVPFMVAEGTIANWKVGKLLSFLLCAALESLLENIVCSQEAVGVLAANQFVDFSDFIIDLQVKDSDCPPASGQNNHFVSSLIDEVSLFCC